MQFILLFESNNKSKTDYKYFSALKELMIKGRTGNKFSPVFMNGKGNYDKFDKQINTLRLKYSGESLVIFFLDVDSGDTDYIQKAFLSKIMIDI